MYSDNSHGLKRVKRDVTQRYKAKKPDSSNQSFLIVVKYYNHGYISILNTTHTHQNFDYY